jgi:succinate dehydrogenase / fumarate reductase cytochrome b subunit
MKKQTSSKKPAARKTIARKTLTKVAKKVAVSKTKKAATVKTVSKKTNKPLVAKAAKVTAKKTIAKKMPKKKAVTKAAKAITVKSATKVTKKVAAAKTSAVKSAVKESPKAKESKSSSNSTFAKTTKPVAPMRDRPLSPHLTIYRPQITSMLSILHRGTGIALYIGAFVLAAFIICLGYGEKCFTAWVDFFKTPAGTFMLFAWMFCLYYHLFNGIRHLMWDIGKGFAMPNVNISGMVVLFVSLTLTFTTFFITHPETLEYLKQWM